MDIYDTDLDHGSRFRPVKVEVARGFLELLHVELCGIAGHLSLGSIGSLGHPCCPHLGKQALRLGLGCGPCIQESGGERSKCY